jgi:putative holliday junction resolvase
MRYLAIDLGDKRTGLALGDAITRSALPVDVIEVSIAERGGEALLDALGKAIDDQLGDARRSPGELVVGLPLNMDGSEGPRATQVRAFIERLLARATPAAPARVVHFQDERLTSVQADWDMGRSGLTHKQKKARRDAIAAATLLADFLAARR